MLANERACGRQPHDTLTGSHTSDQDEVIGTGSSLLINWAKILQMADTLRISASFLLSALIVSEALVCKIEHKISWNFIKQGVRTH